MTYFRTYEKNLIKSGSLVPVGIDEVGRGSFAGPLVICAVIFNGYISKIKNLKDSKQLSRLKRMLIAEKLMKNCNFGIGICWPDEIDTVGMSKCLKIAMSRALESIRLHYGVEADFLLIDGYIKPDFDINHLNIVKGDTKVRTIACASIIAKVVRDNLMHSYDYLYNGFNWHAHVGYGTAKHRNLILKKGVTRIHRKSFLNKVLNEKNSIGR